MGRAGASQPPSLSARRASRRPAAPSERARRWSAAHPAGPLRPGPGSLRRSPPARLPVGRAAAPPGWRAGSAAGAGPRRRDGSGSASVSAPTPGALPRAEPGRALPGPPGEAPGGRPELALAGCGAEAGWAGAACALGQAVPFCSRLRSRLAIGKGLTGRVQYCRIFL